MTLTSLRSSPYHHQRFPRNCQLEFERSRKMIEKASRQTLAEGPDFRLILRQNVYLDRYFLELINRLLRTKMKVRQQYPAIFLPRLPPDVFRLPLPRNSGKK